MRVLSFPLASAVNLNSPGTYLHWSVFYISEANLVLICVMLVIFFTARRGRDALGQRADDPDRVPTSTGRRAVKAAERAEWRGPVRRYDLAREAIAATAIVAAMTFALAGTLSSPDKPPITLKSWYRVIWRRYYKEAGSSAQDAVLSARR